MPAKVAVYPQVFGGDALALATTRAKAKEAFVANARETDASKIGAMRESV